MDQATNIKNAINAFRMLSTPSSITPKIVADLLQAVFNYIEALSLAPQTEVLNLTAQITAALNAASSALTVASQANDNANNQHITVFEPVQGTSTVKIRLKQAGSSVLELYLPLATATKAGLLSKEMFSLIQSAKDKIDNKDVTELSILRSAIGVTVKIIKNDGEIVDGDILGATVEEAGLMTAADKQRLNSLPGPDQVALVEQSGAIKNAHAPHVMLRNVAATSFTEDPVSAGENYFENGEIFHATATEPINLGAPSKELIYCHQDTNELYRWNGTSFVPVIQAPKAGLEIREIRAYSGSSKRYDIPAGVLAVVKATTDTANINLQAGISGRAAIHRIVIEKVDVSSLADDANHGLRWSQNLLWQDGVKPTLQNVNNGDGILVTVINRRYASFIEIEE